MKRLITNAFLLLVLFTTVQTLHAVTTVSSFTVPLSQSLGGVGATTTASARANLGVPTIATLNNYVKTLSSPTLGTLTLNGTQHIKGSPVAILTPASTGTPATYYMSLLLSNTTEMTATGSANSVSRMLEVAPVANIQGSGVLNIQGLVSEPIVTSTNTGIVSITGIQARAFRGNINDKSVSESTSEVGLSSFAGHQASLPVTAHSGTATSGLFTMTSLGGSITTGSSIKSAVNVGNSTNSSSNITTAYGLRTDATIGATSGSGTGKLGTYYAAYFATPLVQSTGTLTNEWGLYQQSTTATNYFGSKVGIGTTSPGYIVDAVGTVNATAFRTATGTSLVWDKYNQWDGGSTGLNATTAKTSLSLNNVENTALSTWAGSTNLTTVGTLGSALTVSGSIKSNGAPSSITYKTNNITLSASSMFVAQETTERAINSGSSYSFYGILSAPRLSTLGAGNAILRGLEVLPQFTTTNSTARLSLTGIRVAATRGNTSDQSSNASNLITGGDFIVQHGSNLPTAAVTTTVVGVKSGIGINHGTATEINGFLSSLTVGTFSVPATANTIYGIRSTLALGSNTGITTNVGTVYGLRIDAPTIGTKTVVGTRYGVSVEDASAKNCFAGTVGIGTTAPSTILELKSARPQATLKGTITGSDGNFGDVVFLNTSGGDGAQVSARRVGADDATAITIYTAATGGSLTERVRVAPTGKVGIGTSDPTSYLDVNADTVRIRTAKTPSSASDTGNAGEICWDSTYIYICVATNTWKRSLILTW